MYLLSNVPAGTLGDEPSDSAYRTHISTRNHESSHLSMDNYPPAPQRVARQIRSRCSGGTPNASRILQMQMKMQRQMRMRMRMKDQLASLAFIRNASRNSGGDITLVPGLSRRWCQQRAD
jgi:hypothetical protein